MKISKHNRCKSNKIGSVKHFIVFLTGLLFSINVFAITNDFSTMIAPKSETIVLGGKINLEGVEKDLSIELSGVDQPAKIKIDDKTYPATLRYVVDAGLESRDYPPSGWYGWHLTEGSFMDPKLRTVDGKLRNLDAGLGSLDEKIKEALDYFSKYNSYLYSRHVVNRKTLVVQLNSNGIGFEPISGLKSSERFPDVKVVKVKYPEELPFTGIALDSEKALSRCDDDRPFTAIAVDDDLISVNANIGQRRSCFILKPL